MTPPAPQGLTRSSLLGRGAAAAAGVVGLAAATRSADSAEAAVAPVGFAVDVRDFGAVGTGLVDDSPAFQKAHDAVVRTGGTIQVPRGTYRLDHPIRFARGNDEWVRLVGEGMGATTIRAGGNNGQLAQFAKVADYDVFRYIEIADLTFDCDQQPNGGGHVLLGVLPWGDSGYKPPLGYQTRLHLNNISLRRVRAINVPSDEGRATGVHLSGVVGTSSDSTQLYITDITLEDVRIDGGSRGFAVVGTAASGPIDDGKTRVFLDRLSFTRCHHDVRDVPTTAAGDANFHIGGVGFGGTVRMRDCWGANSGDIGLEIDGMTDALVEGCTIVDAYRNSFLAGNFRQPENLAAQRYLYLGCSARSKNVDASISGAQPHHYGLQANPAVPHYAFGHLLMIGCQSRYDTPLTNFSVRGQTVYAANARYRGLTIRDLDVALPWLVTENSAAQQPSLVDVVPSDPAVVTIDGVNFRLAGTRSGSGPMTLRFVRLAGQAKARVQNVTADVQITGMASATDLHRILDIGDISGSSVQASLHGVRVVDYASAADVRGVTVNASTKLAIPADAPIVAAACDFSGAPANAGLDYDVHSSQRGKFVARDIVGQRANRGGGLLDGPTPITPGVTPYKYVNPDCIVQTVVVSGGTVTGIDYSADGSSFMSTGLKSGAFRLEPGQALRIAYSAAPKMTKVPA